MTANPVSSIWAHQHSKLFDDSSIEADHNMSKPNKIIAITVKKKLKSKKGLIILIKLFLFLNDILLPIYI